MQAIWLNCDSHSVSIYTVLLHLHNFRRQIHCDIWSDRTMLQPKNAVSLIVFLYEVKYADWFWRCCVGHAATELAIKTTCVLIGIKIHMALITIVVYIKYSPANGVVVVHCCMMSKTVLATGSLTKLTV